MLYKIRVFEINGFKICQLPAISCNLINSWQHENMSNVDDFAAIHSEVHPTKEKRSETTKIQSELTRNSFIITRFYRNLAILL